MPVVTREAESLMTVAATVRLHRKCARGCAWPTSLRAAGWYGSGSGLESTKTSSVKSSVSPATMSCTTGTAPPLPPPPPPPPPPPAAAPSASAPHSTTKWRPALAAERCSCCALSGVTNCDSTEGREATPAAL